MIPLILLTLLALGLRLRFLAAPGNNDMPGVLIPWTLHAATHPWDHAYDGSGADYGPVWMLIFEIVGRGYLAWAPYDPDQAILRSVIKLPSILFDLIGGIVTYAVARRFTEPRRALLAAAAFDLNPAIFFNSCIWGQCDSISTVLTLIAVRLLMLRRRTQAWITFTLALLTKPHEVVIAPIFLLESLLSSDQRPWGKRVREVAVNLLAVLVCAYAVSAPFFTDHAPYQVYQRTLQLYMDVIGMFSNASLGAFNIYPWIFGGAFVPDTIRIGPASLKTWSELAFLVIIILVCLRYHRLQDDRALLESSCLIGLGLFLILTEVHERYFLYALVFAPALIACDEAYDWIALFLSIAGWINLSVCLIPQEFQPLPYNMGTTLNVAAFIILARSYFQRKPMPARACASELHEPETL